MKQTFIEFDKVVYTVDNRAIFSNLSFVIPRGKITVIAGPSGTGKTTALRLITRFCKPHSGKVLVDGENFMHLSRKEIYHRRRYMGFLFQNSALFPHLSVYNNIAFPLREHLNLSEPLIHNIVLLKLQAVGLRGAANLLPLQLSGGMMRRVALARAIVMDPALMMYDEPLTGQDPISIGILLRLMKDLNQLLGLTSVVVSHQLREIKSIADYMVLLVGGKCLIQGSIQMVLKSKNPMVQQFLHGDPDGIIPFHYPSQSLDKEFLS